MGNSIAGRVGNSSGAFEVEVADQNSAAFLVKPLGNRFAKPTGAPFAERLLDGCLLFGLVSGAFVPVTMATLSAKRIPCAAIS